MKQDDPRILVLYSAPSNRPRLRLDIEHRAVEQVLRGLHVDSSLVYRLHATTTEDLTNALLEREYEIIQFSGHGNKEGFLLEDRTLIDSDIIVSAKAIANMLHESSPQLKVAIFMSCYSADSIPELVKAAPFVITVKGAANDSAAIDFIAQFYNAYLRYGVVERAFNMAVNFIDSPKSSGELIPLLIRRPMVDRDNQVLYQANPSGKDDTIYIDLKEAEDDIASLDVSREKFLWMLSRKIKVHKSIFASSRQRVVLPLGKYFGLFSWEDANDVVICHRILSLKESVDESTCEAWASLIVAYNNHYMDSYRTQPLPNASVLERAIKEYQKTNETYFKTSNKAKLIRKETIKQFKVSKGFFSSYFAKAEDKFHQGNYESTVVNLENALSAVHDLLDALTEALTI
jgi:hypothetical protein